MPRQTMQHRKTVILIRLQDLSGVQMAHGGFVEMRSFGIAIMLNKTVLVQGGCYIARFTQPAHIQANKKENVS